MSVVVETTLGDITIDLFTKQRPRACINFLKLCKIKYYNFNLFHTINRSFIAQTGDPTGSRTGGESIWGVIEGPLKRYFEAENMPRIKHTNFGLISFVGTEEKMLGSQFFFTLATDLTYLDEQHCVFGEVVEGQDVLEILNEAICDSDNRPYKDIRITHTVVLDDPFPDPEGLIVPDASPEATAERLQGGRLAPDEEIDEAEGKTLEEMNEMIADREAKARATILEMVGDIPDADIAPPENVLFVCKLNPITNDNDLEIIFSRFGRIKSCEVIRDKKTGDSLQYAFVEFEDQKACEDAYFKMDNVLIDDRRIHVDFSQSVAKVKWLGKGRGVRHYDDQGKSRKDDAKNDVGNGRYKGTYWKRDEDQQRDGRDSNSKDDSSSKKYVKDKYSFNKGRDFHDKRNLSGDSSSWNRAEDSRRDANRNRDYMKRNRPEEFRDKFDKSRGKHRENSEERYRKNSRQRYMEKDSMKNRRESSEDYDRKDSSKNKHESYKNIFHSANRYEKDKHKYLAASSGQSKISEKDRYYNRSRNYEDNTNRNRNKYEETSTKTSEKDKQRSRKDSSSDEESSEEEIKPKKKRKEGSSKKKYSKKDSSEEQSSDSSAEKKKSKKDKKKKKSQKYSSDSDSFSSSESSDSSDSDKKRKKCKKKKSKR